MSIILGEAGSAGDEWRGPIPATKQGTTLESTRDQQGPKFPKAHKPLSRTWFPEKEDGCNGCNRFCIQRFLVELTLSWAFQTSSRQLLLYS